MKQHVVLVALLLFMISSNVLFSQVTKKANTNEKAKLAFSSTITGEEGWQIHRKAYKFQLEAQGYSTAEIKKKLLSLDKLKVAFINNSEILQRKLLELQNKIAVLEDQQTTKQKERMESLKQLAQKQELKAMELIKQVSRLQVQASVQKNREEALYEKAKTLSKQAATLKLYSEENWIKAKNLQGKFETIFSKNLALNGESKKVETFTFNIVKNKMIHLNIRGALETGYALIEVRNPQGEQKGQLILDNSRQTDKSKLVNVSGSLNKYFVTDVVGEWRIVVSSTLPLGKIKFSIVQYELHN